MLIAPVIGVGFVTIVRGFYGAFGSTASLTYNIRSVMEKATGGASAGRSSENLKRPKFDESKTKQEKEASEELKKMYATIKEEE